MTNRFIRVSAQYTASSTRPSSLRKHAHACAFMECVWARFYTLPASITYLHAPSVDYLFKTPKKRRGNDLNSSYATDSVGVAL